MFKKASQVIFILFLALTFVLGYTYQKDVYLLYKLSNASFVSGFFCLGLALVIQIRNIGLFKSVAYANYRRRLKKESEQPMEMYEFTQEKYGLKISNYRYFIFSALLFTLSIVSALVV